MKKYFLLPAFSVALLSLIITTSFAQQIQTNAKPNATIDIQRLARIDDLVNSYVKKKLAYRCGNAGDKR